MEPLMSKFDEKIDLILEALFTGADEEEIQRRDAIAPEIMLQDWVEEFLKRKDITKNSDGSYDVHGNVDIDDHGFIRIPIKFRKVDGNFFCDWNRLTNLNNCPIEVGGGFFCSVNLLTSLKGCPKKCSDFNCSSNPTLMDRDLRYGPQIIVQGGANTLLDYYCSRCNLTSLAGAPEEVNTFKCSGNSLTSLKGAPKKINEDFICIENSEGDFTEEDVLAVSTVENNIKVRS